GRMRRLGTVAGTAAVVALGMIVFLHLDLIDMLQDLRIAGVARSRSLQPWHGVGALDAVQIALILIFGWSISAASKATWERVGWLLLTLATLTVGYLVLVTNQQKELFPLNGYFAVILAVCWPIRFGAPLRWRHVRPDFPTGFLLVMCVLPFYGIN